VVTGSYAQVAAYFDAVAAAGLRGACLVFPDFEPDLHRFIGHVVPLMTSRSAEGAISQA
jgi:pyrimidine oxygenase